MLTSIALLLRVLALGATARWAGGVTTPSTVPRAELRDDALVMDHDFRRILAIQGLRAFLYGFGSVPDRAVLARAGYSR
jgi:hypothetical protein